MKKSIKVNEIEKLLKTNMPNCEVETFITNAQRYIKAIKQRRMICSIDRVSKSGMSRVIKFLEISKLGNSHHMYEFYYFFKSMGYRAVSNSDCFRIDGCGMDMIFHTNYEIIHQLGSLGFLSESQVTTLAQQTPHIV